MPLVPYVPKPLPDEILGSWLARVLYHNGKGTWQTLLKECGYGDRIGPTFFDLIDYDAKIDKLLTLLGSSYERALEELTTLPYWLTFVSSSNPTPLPGTSATRAPVNTRGHQVDCLRVFGLKRNHGRATNARFCPQCLLDDQNRHGEVYWHRSHQLPNVLFCPAHHCELYVECPDCGVRATAPLRQLMPLPKLICECGYRFDSSTSTAQPSDAYLALAHVSAAALNVARPQWTRVHVVSQLKRWFAGETKKKHDTYLKLLEATFGADVSDGGSNVRLTTRKTRDIKSLYFRESPSTGSAPDFCGLLVAMNKRLPEAISGFKQTCIESEQNAASLPRVRKERQTSRVSDTAGKTGYDRKRLQLERCLALTEAFHKLLSRPELPASINAGILGRLAGLSHEQASTVIQSHEFLKDAIIQANANLYRRKIFWAVSALRAEGEKITKAKIRDRAGLPQNAKAEKIMAAFSLDAGTVKFKSDTERKSPASFKQKAFVEFG